MLLNTIPRGARCNCRRRSLTIPSLLAVLILFIEAQPTTGLLSKQALEKLYGEMMQRNRGSTSQFLQRARVQKPIIENSLLDRIYHQRQVNGRGKRHAGITSRTQIYSISSHRYVSVEGALVAASASKHSSSAVILMETVGFGKVLLRGEKSNTYICFNKRGKLVGKVNSHETDCVFQTHTSLPGHYTSFQSLSKPNFWMGARRRGHMKKGKRTAAGQRATKFIVIRL